MANGEKLRGLLTAILTPLDTRGELALGHFAALLDFQRKAGVDGVIVCGTNGEGTSLSTIERKQALETALEHRGGLTVVAGTGAASVTDAIELTQHAANVGADAVLVLPPFFFKNPDARGVAEYFKRVLDAADIPVLLYNIPQHSAVVITDAILELLIDHPNLAGIKDSAGNWEDTEHYITTYPNLRIFAGSDRLAYQSHLHGAGGISGGANAFPEVLAAVRDACKKGAAEGAEAQTRLNTLLDITTRYPFISTSKSILAHRGLPRLGVRPPLMPLSEEQEQNVIAELTAAGFLQ